MTLDGTNDPAIEAIRERIDRIDEALIELLDRRRQASADVQRARTSVGGPRLDPGREEQILGRYERAFRRPGREVARMILAVCRGEADGLV